MNALVLREAVVSVALSHPEGHDCDACRAARGDGEAFLRILVAAQDKAHDPLPGSPPVDAQTLEAHARKYGAECVTEVADEHGLDVGLDDAATPPRRRRR